MWSSTLGWPRICTSLPDLWHTAVPIVRRAPPVHRRVSDGWPSACHLLRLRAPSGAQLSQSSPKQRRQVGPARPPTVPCRRSERGDPHHRPSRSSRPLACAGHFCVFHPEYSAGRRIIKPGRRRPVGERRGPSAARAARGMVVSTWSHSGPFVIESLPHLKEGVRSFGSRRS